MNTKTIKELAKRGLAPKVKNVWSLVEDGD